MPDGRLAKGAVRRRALLAATLRIVGREGIGAVSQRAVAAEADVPPSAVLYYFATVDELLVTTLREVNDRYCAELSQVTTVEDLAAHLGALDPQTLLAEYELWLVAARRPELRGELHRWVETVEALASRLAPDRAEAFAATLDGLYLRAVTGTLDAESATRVLRISAG
jgi:TetR/AcrR family transcriptional regulator, regulator of biofilm formation and stress response